MSADLFLRNMNQMYWHTPPINLKLKDLAHDKLKSTASAAVDTVKLRALQKLFKNFEQQFATELKNILSYRIEM